MRWFSSFLIIVSFCLCNVVFAEETVGIKQVSIQRERDPFNVSTKLLTETVSGRYVSFSEGALGYFDLPKIEITGIMVVGDKVMATAEIETLGTVTLKPGEKIIIKSDKSSERAFKSFIIKEITPSELVVLLEDGLEIRGRFR